MLTNTISLLVFGTIVSAQFQRNAFGKSDQYDDQGNLIQRTPSFLANSQQGSSSFGIQTLAGNNDFQRQNQNRRLNQQLGGNPFDNSAQFNSAVGQSNRFRSLNEPGNLNQANNKFGQQTSAQFGLQNQAAGQFGQTAGQFGQTAGQFGQSAGRFGQQRLAASQFGQQQSAGQFGQQQRQSAGQFGNQQAVGQFRTAEAGASVINSRSENDGLGQYSFGYETDSGVIREESGQPIGLDSYAVSGSYSYTSPEGIEVTVRYIADENGFQVESPNLPPVPLHAQEQIEAAKEAKRLGLIDESGNRLGDQGQLRSFGTNAVSNSNLLNLVNQNRNSATNFGPQDDLGRFSGGLTQQQQLNSQSRFGNLQRTAVSRRPIGSSFDANQGNPLLQPHSANFNAGGLSSGTSQFANNRFNSNQQGFGSTGNTRSFRQSNLNDNFSGNRRQGQIGQFVTPSFQNQIASRFTVDEGGSFRSAAHQAALTHGSDIISDSTGNVASYRVKS